MWGEWSQKRWKASENKKLSENATYKVTWELESGRWEWPFQFCFLWCPTWLEMKGKIPLSPRILRQTGFDTEASIEGLQGVNSCRWWLLPHGSTDSPRWRHLKVLAVSCPFQWWLVRSLYVVCLQVLQKVDSTPSNQVLFCLFYSMLYFYSENTVL